MSGNACDTCACDRSLKAAGSTADWLVLRQARQRPGDFLFCCGRGGLTEDAGIVGTRAEACTSTSPDPPSATAAFPARPVLGTEAGHLAARGTGVAPALPNRVLGRRAGSQGTLR